MTREVMGDLIEAVRVLQAEADSLDAFRHMENIAARKRTKKMAADIRTVLDGLQSAEARVAAMEKDAENYLHWQVRCDTLAAELKVAEARNRVLVEALEPFAAFSEVLDPDEADIESYDYGVGLEGDATLFIGDFRRAAEALSQSHADIAAREASRSDGHNHSGKGE